MIKKINTAIRSMQRDVNVVNTTATGGTGGAKYHRDLPDIAQPNCHPIEAIAGLAEQLQEINASLTTIKDDIVKMALKLDDMQETIEDHENRIKALEGE